MLGGNFQAVMFVNFWRNGGFIRGCCLPTTFLGKKSINEAGQNPDGKNRRQQRRSGQERLKEFAGGESVQKSHVDYCEALSPISCNLTVRDSPRPESFPAINTTNSPGSTMPFSNRTCSPT